jgi:REP element-mobilizing transposase RayT
VVMPDHVHLLLTEPERTKLFIALQMLKQNVARRLRGPEARSGNPATTISTCGATPTKPKSYVIFIAIRSGGGWCKARRVGVEQFPALPLRRRGHWGDRVALDRSQAGAHGNFAC